MNLDDFNQIQEELTTTDIFGTFQNSSEEEKEIENLSSKPVVVNESLRPTPKSTNSKAKSALCLVSYPSSDDEI